MNKIFLSFLSLTFLFGCSQKHYSYLKRGKLEIVSEVDKKQNTKPKLNIIESSFIADRTNKPTVQKENIDQKIKVFSDKTYATKRVETPYSENVNDEKVLEKFTSRKVNRMVKTASQKKIQSNDELIYVLVIVILIVLLLRLMSGFILWLASLALFIVLIYLLLSFFGFV